jgi:hypothetical protein
MSASSGGDGAASAHDSFEGHAAYPGNDDDDERGCGGIGSH